MSDITVVQQRADQVMKFVPYGSSDEIKLSVDIIQKIVAVPTRSGKTCSQRDAIKFMMMCQAKRLNPFEGDAFLIGYDGQNGAEFSLITAHQAFLKRAELHPEFDGMQSGLIVRENEKLVEIEGDFYTEDQTVVGGWATVHHKTRKYPTTRKLRLERFNKGFAQWKVDAAGMICKCAEADALRSSFPTMLGGLYLREEIELNVGPAVRDMVNEPKQLKPTFAPVERSTTGTETDQPAATDSPSDAVPAESGHKTPTPIEATGNGESGASAAVVTDAAQTPPRSIQDDLAAECLKVPGCTWDTLHAVAVALGWFSDKQAADWQRFSDVSDAVARRLYGARASLAAKLTEAVAKGIV